LRSRLPRAIAVLTILLGSNVAFASGKTSGSRPQLLVGVSRLETTEQAREWLTYYYLHPRPDLLASALDLLSKDGALQSSSPIVALTSRLCALEPKRLDGWVDHVLRSSEDEQFFLASALWAADTAEGRASLERLGRSGSPRLQQFVQNMLGDTPMSVLTAGIESPASLDALWASFFATGEDAYVKRVITALPLMKTKGDTARLLIGGAAHWSLTSNAIQHPRVMAICESELMTAGGDVKTILSEVVERAKEGRH